MLVRPNKTIDLFSIILQSVLKLCFVFTAKNLIYKISYVAPNELLLTWVGQNIFEVAYNWHGATAMA